MPVNIFEAHVPSVISNASTLFGFASTIETIDENVRRQIDHVDKLIM